MFHTRSLTRRAFACGLGAAALAGFAQETGPLRAVLFNLAKGATHDGPGLRTVCFLKGCPLRCQWCHSPECWNYRIESYPNGETIGREWTSEELLAEVLKDRDFYEATGGGVTLSGGEPLAQADFTLDFFIRAKGAGLHTAIETSGFANADVVERLLPYVDCWLYDVKVLDPKRCLALTSRPLAPVLANLRRVDRACRGVKGRMLVLRRPMIPGLNDDAAELRALGRLADELESVARIDVEPYVPYGIDKARRLGLKVYEAPRPPIEYGPAKVKELAGYTRRPVALG